MNFTKSEALHKEALEHIVGGVNSPSRSFKAVGGGSPVAMERGKGAYFWDVDGNKYIDYLAAYGPIITGHAHPHVTEAIKTAAENGVLYGTPTALEVKFAKMLKEAMPALDKVRFVNSGTESVMCLHWPHKNYEIRWLLPRSFRFSTCSSWLWSFYPWNS